MRTLDQVIKKCPRNRIRNAKYVKLVSIKKGYHNGLAYIACRSRSTAVVNPFGHVIPNRDPKTYVTMFTFLDKKLNIKASCSCPDFFYRWEVALHHKGAADIQYSTGTDPDVTNPGMVAGCCKHLIALRTYLKEKFDV